MSTRKNSEMRKDNFIRVGICIKKDNFIRVGIHRKKTDFDGMDLSFSGGKADSFRS